MVTPRMRSVDWNLLSPRLRKMAAKGHSSYEECGLKCDCGNYWSAKDMSLLVWGVWIEIWHADVQIIVIFVTPRMRSVDWNRWTIYQQPMLLLSLLVWGVWIEITRATVRYAIIYVTPRMRSVDWNFNVWRFCTARQSHSSYEECGLKLFLLYIS